MRSFLLVSIVLTCQTIFADEPCKDCPSNVLQDVMPNVEVAVPEKPLNFAFNLLNNTRKKLGLYPLEHDPELTEIAEERLETNVNRGSWRHHKKNGKLLGRFFPAKAEGCGCTTTDERWFTCYLKTRNHKHAGCAISKVGNKYWQLLLVR